MDAVMTHACRHEVFITTAKAVSPPRPPIHTCGPFCLQAVRSPDRTARSLRIWTYAKNCAPNLPRFCFMAAFYYRANPLTRDLLEMPCLP